MLPLNCISSPSSFYVTLLVLESPFSVYSPSCSFQDNLGSVKRALLSMHSTFFFQSASLDLRQHACLMWLVEFQSQALAKVCHVSKIYAKHLIRLEMEVSSGGILTKVMIMFD